MFHLVKEVPVPPKPIVVGGRVLARRDGNRHNVYDILGHYLSRIWICILLLWCFLLDSTLDIKKLFSPSFQLFRKNKSH
jgi:hypothetical protein